jgi:hypothetical protein
MLQKPAHNGHVAKFAFATAFATRLTLLRKRSFLNMAGMWVEGRASTDPR